jgi:quercetin dioxygenase-like cupin family protein
MKRAPLMALIFVSACVSIDANIAAPSDAFLAAVQNAHVRECPPAHHRADAHSEGFGASAGVSSEDIAFTPLASDPTRAMRLRRIVVQPGGVIPWHDHTAIQGMALLVSGEMVELRNTCLDPITYRAGDVAIEDVNTAHSWRNESDEIAVVLVSHVVAR